LARSGKKTGTILGRQKVNAEEEELGKEKRFGLRTPGGKKKQGRYSPFGRASKRGKRF